jgi:hypothetical protein
MERALTQSRSDFELLNMDPVVVDVHDAWTEAARFKAFAVRDVR